MRLHLVRRYVSIYKNGSVLGYTDKNGNFRIELPARTERVTLRFADDVFLMFYDKIQTVNFARGSSGTFYDTVLMSRRAVPVQIDSTEESTVDAPNLNFTITVPANAIYNTDGSLYTVNSV